MLLFEQIPDLWLAYVQLYRLIVILVCAGVLYKIFFDAVVFVFVRVVVTAEKLVHRVVVVRQASIRLVLSRLADRIAIVSLKQWKLVLDGPVLEAFGFGGRRLKELFVEHLIFPKLWWSNKKFVAYRMVIISLLGSYGAFSLGEVECLGREFGLWRQN